LAEPDTAESSKTRAPPAPIIKDLLLKTSAFMDLMIEPASQDRSIQQALIASMCGPNLLR
jgi:hypothetical protein